MAVTSRQRSVPPSMFSDEELVELPPEVRLTGLGLRFHADDHGRGSANATLIRSNLYPLTPSITDDVIDDHLLALDDAGYIRLYSASGRTYFVVSEWPKTDRAQPSRLPDPPDDMQGVTADTSSSRAARETPAVVGREGEGGEREGEESAGGGSAERGRGEGERARATLAGTPEPSPFCKKHTPTQGTDDPCRPCGRARLAHEQWVKAQVEAEDLEGAA